MTRPGGQLLNPDAPGVLVTGAAGEVGHAILRGLAAGGAREVVATDLRSVDMDGAACVQGDLLDPSLVESLFTGTHWIGHPPRRTVEFGGGEAS